MSSDSVKTLIFGLFALVFLLMMIITARTLTMTTREMEFEECKPLDTDFIRADGQLIQRFQDAVRIQTISRNPGDYNTKELLQIQQHIKKSFPVLHSSPLVKHEVIANYSLLYSLAGSDPKLTPYMLMGHLDVVPIPDPSVWEVPPFSGDIKDGFIYGRGTIDNKQTVFGILEAIEFHLKRGFKPRRGIYLAFGHDEEVGGPDGAQAISKVLTERGVRLEFISDEGLTIIDGLVPGIDKPCALLGSSEKGSLTLDLTVKVKGGHSSMPSRESAIGILARAVARLEDNPHVSQFGTGPERGMFEHLAPAMKLPFRVVMSNLWLFQPLVSRHHSYEDDKLLVYDHDHRFYDHSRCLYGVLSEISLTAKACSRFLSAKPETNAMVRTTTAVTEFHAGIKENVIAPEARAVVNHRIHPSQTVQQIIEADRQIINDERVEIKVRNSMEPHPHSPYCDECFGYQTMKTSIRQVWGRKDIIVAPALMIGNTDTKHYLKLTQNIYRFSPTYMYPGDPPRFHGINERISVENYEQAVNFFYHLIDNADKAALGPYHSHSNEL